MIDLPPGYTVAEEVMNSPLIEKYLVTVYRDPKGRFVWEEIEDTNAGRGRAWDHYEQIQIKHTLKGLPND